MTGSFERAAIVRASPQDVWALLHDVDRLASFSTRIGPVTILEPGESWTTSLRDRVGLLTLSAPMRVELIEERHLTLISIRASGQDRGPGTRLLVEARMTIEPYDDQVALTLEGSYELTGRVARLGAPVARRQADAMISEFWVNLTAALP